MTPERASESWTGQQQIRLRFLNNDLNVAFTFARMAKAVREQHPGPYKQHALWALETVRRSKDRIESRIERLRIEQRVFALERIISTD